MHAALLRALHGLPDQSKRALVLAHSDLTRSVNSSGSLTEGLTQIERIAWLRLKDRLPSEG
jgi:2-oxo-4-hydroxy-4-carboxy--5-ureidoimidazoline (OHCU) decarboxylase